MTVIQLLLENGAEVGAVDYLDQTPLFFAAKDNRLDALILLVEHGATVSFESANRETPLIIAARVAHARIV